MLSNLNNILHFINKLDSLAINDTPLGKQDSEALASAKGYAAPEANGSGTDIIKADIYSFGVILLVLLTGQKAFDRFVTTHHLCHTSNLVY
jgi:serine/threonine protein kinase